MITQAPPRDQLLALLAADPLPLADAAALLDSLPNAERIAAARAIPGALQRRLYDAAAKSEPLALADFVPADVPDMRPVRHYGRNSLPAFTHFEKRFCRPPGELGRTRLWGYNHQPLAWLVGAGHMVAYEKDGEIWVDYREWPASVPEGWPATRPAAHGLLPRLVWKDMVDRCRRVSKYVTIGRAHRPTEPEPHTFVLCREEA
jgi:hypothetical protein